MSIFDDASHRWLAWMLASSWQLALLSGIIVAVAYVARDASPRFRYGLWLLVLVKVFLPPGLTTPLSIGHWAVGPVVQSTGLSVVITEQSSRMHQPAGRPAADRADPERAPSAADRLPSPSLLLMIVWVAGSLLFAVGVAWRCARLAGVLRSATAIDEGPVRIMFEEIALVLDLRKVPELLATPRLTGPFLIGLIRPRIVLPETVLAELSKVELQAVLTHELLHWKRRDTWIGWLQVLAQGLFWFHPCVWWANNRLRHERECVCDLMVLRLGRITPRDYGESIFRVLTVSRGRSLVTGSLVGIFERGAQLQKRLEDIMRYEPARRETTWTARIVLAVIAILLVPMAPGMVVTQLAEARDKPSAADTQAANDIGPQVVDTTPKRGATGVDPGLKEITITFDRDMGQGMSWTGGPPLFPPIDETAEARWTDARTCVLPVKLKRGAYYRVGINSTSYQNFRAADGPPASHSAIYFTTTGATSAIESHVRVPKIVTLQPANGADEVDPKTETLRVTFDMPMSDGMSWTGSGENFPASPAGKEAAWSKDGRTCTLPVTLQAEHDFQLGINSPSHVNFQSKWGVPLEPVVYTFKTRAAKK